MSWGKPTDINRTVVRGRIHEQWVYSGGSYLYFDDGLQPEFKTEGAVKAVSWRKRPKRRPGLVCLFLLKPPGCCLGLFAGEVRSNYPARQARVTMDYGPAIRFRTASHLDCKSRVSLCHDR